MRLRRGGCQIQLLKSVNHNLARLIEERNQGQVSVLQAQSPQELSVMNPHNGDANTTS